jgi:hypothetical protein
LLRFYLKSKKCLINIKHLFTFIILHKNKNDAIITKINNLGIKILDYIGCSYFRNDYNNVSSIMDIDQFISIYITDEMYPTIELYNDLKDTYFDNYIKNIIIDNIYSIFCTPEKTILYLIVYFKKLYKSCKLIKLMNLEKDSTIISELIIQNNLSIIGCKSLML